MKNKITIYDIAQTAGVSPATVSRMIHQPNIVTKKTRDKILEAFSFYQIAPEDLHPKRKIPLSRLPKKQLANRRRSCLHSLLDNPFYDDILKGIWDYLKQTHYHMIVTQEIPQRGTMNSFLTTAPASNT